MIYQRGFDALGRDYVNRDEERLFCVWNTQGQPAWKTHSPGTVGGFPAMADVMTLGNFPLAFDVHDQLYVQQDQLDHLYVCQPETGVFVNIVPAEYRSEGIHHIEPDGTPVMGNGRHLTVRGVELWNASQDALGNWCGLGAGGGPSGCIAFVPVTGEPLMWVCPTDCPFPPRISQGRVAISGTFETPAPGDWSAWVPFKLYEAPEPAKPVLLPLPDGPFPPCWLGIQSDWGTIPEACCIWSPSSRIGDQRPVTETVAGAKTILGLPFLHGLWLSDRDNPPQTVDGEIAFTKQKGAYAVYLHRDADTSQQTANVANASLRVQGAGLHSIIASHIYDQPIPTGNVYAGLTMNVRTVGRDLSVLARNWSWFVAQLKSGHCEVAYLTNVFERDALNDLSEQWPELARQVDELIARVPKPLHFPGYVEPPVIQPPPIVQPPPQPPSKGQWARFLLALKRIFGRKR